MKNEVGEVVKKLKEEFNGKGYEVEWLYSSNVRIRDKNSELYANLFFDTFNSKKPSPMSLYIGTSPHRQGTLYKFQFGRTDIDELNKSQKAKLLYGVIMKYFDFE